MFALFLAIVALVRIFIILVQDKEYKEGDAVSVRTLILIDPKLTGTTQRITARLDGSGNKAFVYLPSYPRYSFGDTLQIDGKISVRDVGGDRVYFINFPAVERVSEKNLFMATLSGSRQRIIEAFEQVLPQSSSSLLLGMVFGIKQSFPANFEDNLKKTGVMHVIAASGMNVSMLGGFLAGLFAYFFRRRLALFLTIGGILIYAVFAGLEASIIRASVMGIIAFSAQILGRQSFSIYALFLSALIMLVAYPAIILDIGFQLSFMATLGIITLKPILEEGCQLYF